MKKLLVLLSSILTLSCSSILCAQLKDQTQSGTSFSYLNNQSINTGQFSNGWALVAGIGFNDLNVENRTTQTGVEQPFLISQYFAGTYYHFINAFSGPSVGLTLGYFLSEQGEPVYKERLYFDYTFPLSHNLGFIVSSNVGLNQNQTYLYDYSTYGLQIGLSAATSVHTAIRVIGGLEFILNGARYTQSGNTFSPEKSEVMKIMLSYQF